VQALQQVDDQLVMAFVEFTGLDGVRRVQRDADRHRLAVAQRVIGEHLEFVGGPVPDVQGTHVVLLEGVTAGRYRGLYIQANNMLVFRSPDVAALYGQMFDLALADPRKFRDTDFAKTWHVVTTRNKPTVQVCFSPHRERTCRSTRFAQPWTRPPRRCCIRWRFGGVFEPDDRGADRGRVPPAGQATRLQLRNCRQSRTRGIADFAFLAAHAPELFKSEWSGRRGRNIHHKFVVTDFNLPTAKVFTGSKQLLAVRRSRQ